MLKIVIELRDICNTSPQHDLSTRINATDAFQLFFSFLTKANFAQFCATSLANGYRFFFFTVTIHLATVTCKFQRRCDSLYRSARLQHGRLSQFDFTNCAQNKLAIFVRSCRRINSLYDKLSDILCRYQCMIDSGHIALH